MICFAQNPGVPWEAVGQWPPAILTLLIVLWFIDRAAKRYVEKGFRDLRDAMIRLEVNAAERHEEAMSLLRDIRNEACYPGNPRRRRRDDPPDSHD